MLSWHRRTCESRYMSDDLRFWASRGFGQTVHMAHFDMQTPGDHGQRWRKDGEVLILDRKGNSRRWIDIKDHFSEAPS